MKTSGILLYCWALIFNVGIVLLLLIRGGGAGFCETLLGWAFLGLAAYLLVVIGIVKTGQLNHPLLVYGIPLVVVFLITHELTFGPTLNLITLGLIFWGRIRDVSKRSPDGME